MGLSLTMLTAAYARGEIEVNAMRAFTFLSEAL